MKSPQARFADYHKQNVWFLAPSLNSKVSTSNQPTITNSKHSHTGLHFEQLTLDLRRVFPSLQPGKKILNTSWFFVSLTSETKRWNLVFTLHPSPLKKKKKTGFPPHYPFSCPKLAPSPPSHLSNLATCYPLTFPTLLPHYPHTTFPPFQLTTLTPPSFPTFPAHYSPTLPSSPPSQWQIDRSNMATFFH